MTDPAPNAQVDLILDRRRQLKQQRQSRFLQAAWRTLVTLGIAVGLGWAVSQPEWKLRQQSQVTISGNRQLSTASLEALVPLSFPLSLIRLEPQRIETLLQDHAHVRQALVSRKLFPPRVTIFVKERSPVALTRCDRCLLITDPNNPEALKLGPADVWILDDQGVPVPAQNYPTFAQAKMLPPLAMDSFLAPLQKPSAALKKIVASQNAKPVVVDQAKQQQWQQMYAVLKQSPVLQDESPVKLSSIDWQDLDNLKLQTKVGKIHLGPHSKQFAKQLQALDELRSLGDKLDIGQIVYIDLQNPDQPDLEMRNAPTPQEPPAT